MLELPAGVWRFLDAHGKDIARCAKALERIAAELKAIREELEKDDDERSES